jgi:hypothetical protein
MKAQAEAVRQRGVIFSALELVLLLAIVGAFLRSLVYIGYGLDPHHDYYSASPGVFALDGLRPNLEFYTHYGPVDAAIKGWLLRFSGNKLIVLRSVVWALQLLGLLLVCYGCELGRRSRCWLLALIGLWSIWEPSATGMRAVLYWHPMAWSSEIALVLICLLLVCSYWAYRGRSSAQGKAASLPFDVARGALVLFVFFTKFTVGIAMVAALFLAEVVYWFRYAPVRRAVFGRWLAIALGVLVALLLTLALVGGPAGLLAFSNQALLGQYDHFSGGNPFSLLIGLRNYIFNPKTVLAILIVVVVLGRSAGLTRVALWVVVTIFTLMLFGQHMVYMTRGKATVPDQTVQIALTIGAMICAYAVLLALRNLSSDLWRAEGRQPPGREEMYGLTVLPIGLFSLLQFYPVLDPWHAWWSVGTALPAAAYIAEGWSQQRLRGDQSALLALFTALNVVALAFTSWVLKVDIARNPYLFLAPPQSDDFFAGIRTVDGQAVATGASLRQLVAANPRLIILEAGPTSLFDLFATSASRRARTKCLIRPLQTVRPAEFPPLLSCLQQLKAQGWEVVITNSNNPKNNDTKFGKAWAAPYAIVSQGETPKLVRAAREKGISFRQRSQGSIIYWQLQ